MVDQETHDRPDCEVLELRVLVVHNRYRSAFPSGENMVVDREIAMLRDAGVAVDTYIRDSDEIEHFGPVKRAGLAARPIYSLEDAKAFKARIRSFGPDVVHLHNPYPLISPAVIRVAKAEGVPVVQSVHNYRFACANGLYFRDGRVCQDCLGKRVPWPAVTHSCYRGSMAQSAIMASSLAIHRATWQMVDRFLPVSDFVAKQLAAAGVPPEKITVKPNATPDPGEPAPIGKGFLFAGRLEEEKGIKLLLEAWRLSGLGKATTLTIVGDGAGRSAVEQAARVNPSIHYLGSVPADQVGQLLDDCAVRVVPSLWFEAAPLAVIESYARGRPVISTSVGASASVVSEEVGWVCPTTSAAGLAETIRQAFGDHNSARVRGMAARSLYERSYLPGEVTRSLLGIYGELERAKASSGTNPFLRGDRLYGEDLSDEEIARWVADEREAYADLGAGELPAESYARRRFDHFHGVSRLPDGRFKSVLSLGSAKGGEFQAIIDRIDELTIVEPPQKLRSRQLGGLQPRYVDSSPDATLPFPDASFDLVFCLSVLHHIPKVSAQVRELARVLSPGGHMLVLEPIVSLGDWTGPRKAGLTKHERGIPLSLLRSMLTDEGLVIEYQALCDFPITRRLPRGYDSVWSVRLDRLLSKATAWNYRYHPTSAIQKIGPTGSFFVVTKPRSPQSVAAP
jgi:glycosyltransferase involved in cell wall biosynthesis/SAM-dependent methyltransferase